MEASITDTVDISDDSFEFEISDEDLNEFWDEGQSEEEEEFFIQTGAKRLYAKDIKITVNKTTCDKEIRSGIIQEVKHVLNKVRNRLSLPEKHIPTVAELFPLFFDALVLNYLYLMICRQVPDFQKLEMSYFLFDYFMLRFYKSSHSHISKHQEQYVMLKLTTSRFRKRCSGF